MKSKKKNTSRKPNFAIFWQNDCQNPLQQLETQQKRCFEPKTAKISLKITWKWSKTTNNMSTNWEEYLPKTLIWHILSYTLSGFASNNSKNEKNRYFEPKTAKSGLTMTWKWSKAAKNMPTNWEKYLPKTHIWYILLSDYVKTTQSRLIMIWI